VLIVYDREKGNIGDSRRLERSQATISNVKLFGDASSAAMLPHASGRRFTNRSRSAETTTFHRRRRLLEQQEQSTAPGAPTTSPLKNAQDYFITTRSGFPWSTIPDFVVGRAGVDNWLMVTALARRAAVVDASGTITARHQVRAGYKPSAHFTQPAGDDAAVNYALAGRSFDYSLGLTDCAPLETASLTATGRRLTIDDCQRTIALRQRQLNRYCRRAYVKLRGRHQVSRRLSTVNYTSTITSLS